jgi:hypothetical protein
MTRALGRGVLGACAVALCLSLPAHAQSPAQMAAELTFTEGVRLMKSGDCNAALSSFEESQRLDPASGTLLDIAYCQSVLGKKASAWLTYRKALALAQASARAEHAALAREQGEALFAELPRLTAAVPPSSSPELSVLLDGQPLPRELWNEALPLDAGGHTLLAERGGRRSQKTFSVEQGQHVVLEIPAEVALAPVRSEPPAASVAPPPVLGTQRTWALAVGGAGAAAALGGGLLFTLARVQYDAQASACPDNACEDEAFEARQAAVDKAELARGLFVASAALLGTGALLWFSAGTEQPDRSVVIAPRVGGGSVAWRSRF